MRCVRHRRDRRARPPQPIASTSSARRRRRIRRAALTDGLRGAARPSRRRHVGRPTSWRRSISASCATIPPTRRAPGRDRFVMSKGHCTGALLRRRWPRPAISRVDELATYMQPLSRLNGHPNRNYLPGVETNTGPLGHGLPVAVGIAIAGQIDGADFRIFVLTGDGELQEGSNWEAAMTRRPPQARQPDADRRPQPPAAGRRHRGDQRPRAAGRQVARLRLGRRRGRRPRPRGAAAMPRRAARPARQAALRHRPHRSRDGRVLHGGPGALAPRRAQPRRSSTRRWRSSPA